MIRRDFLKSIPSVSLTSVFSAEVDLRKLYLEHIFHEDKYEIIVSEIGGVTYHTASDTTDDEKVIEYTYDPYNDCHCYRFQDFTSVPVQSDLGYADSALEAKQILKHKE